LRGKAETQREILVRQRFSVQHLMLLDTKGRETARSKLKAAPSSEDKLEMFPTN